MSPAALLSRALALAAIGVVGVTAQGRCSYQGPFDLSKIDPASPNVEKVVLIAKPGIRCTMAAEARLNQNNVCYENVDATADGALFRYMQCLHPETDMHSFVYMGGQYIGDGFMLLSDLSDGRCSRASPNGGRVNCLQEPAFQQALAVVHADTSCDACGHISDNQVPARFPGPLQATIDREPIALFGWSGCPCTADARAHFQSEEWCFAENVWPSPQDKLFQYLQCRYGAEHHSFIFVGGQFLGNGFAFDMSNPRAPYSTNAAFDPLAIAAGGRQSCPFAGLQNLLGDDLQSCTQPNDRIRTGWTRSGSCNWDPNDGGYHEVCVEMSREFLDDSVTYDHNDLSSVVSVGGHWCICAWAFASAVSRAPGEDTPEGITLDCESTNGQLRDVYTHFATLRSPSGATYRSRNALTLVDRLCPKDAELTGDGAPPSPPPPPSPAADDEPCYTVDAAHALQFPAWHDACPSSLVPLPAHCTPSCAAVYAPWFNRCGTDTFISNIDAQINGAFTQFAEVCQRGN
jgi:uncharacterized protein (DUF2237 family)